MSFLYPAWFLTLIFIPLIVLAALIIRKNRNKVWSAFVSVQHQSELVKQSKPMRFWLAFSCSLLGLTCLIIAMSRPYYGNSISREKIESRNILIAMDTSLSMLCEDIQPNRLNSGITFAVNLIEALPDDHFGIMAYAGNPNVITSLSIDHPSIIEELGHLGVGSAHIAGSNLKDALYEGINTLKRAGKQANALILITDGSETLDEIDEITSIARESYVQIFTVGVGTSAGGTIPVNGEPHRDMQQKVVITKLEDNVLRQLARDTSGVYTHINTQPERAIANAIQSMSQFEQQGREVEIPNELYQWFLAPGVLLLLTSAFFSTRFKSSITALVIISFFSSLSDANANETTWIESISTKYLDRPAQTKAGYSALAKKDYTAAIDFFKQARAGTEGDTHATLSLAIAQAAYRLGDYPLATKEYSQALITSQPEIQHISQYNLANALFKQHTSAINVPDGKNLTTYLKDQLRSEKLSDPRLETMEEGLANALVHYDDLLKINPQHSSAESNKKRTEQVIDAIKEARKIIAKEKQQEQEEREKEKEKEKKKDKDKKNPDDKENGDSTKKPDDKKQGDKKGDQEDKDGKQGEGDKSDKKGNQGDEGDEKKSDDSEKESKAGENDDSSNDTKAKQPDNNDKEPNTDKPAEFKSKEEALDFLKKHSDSRKKPLTNRRGFYNRPAIDW